MPLDQSALPWNANKPVVSPPAELLKDDAALVKALSKVVAAETASRDAGVALAEAEAAVEPAKLADARAAANALAAGKADPGQTGGKRAVGAVADREHQVRTLRNLADDARAEFQSALAEDAAERRARWNSEFDALAQGSLKALVAAKDALSRRANLKALVSWQAERGERYVPQEIEVAREIHACQERLEALDANVRNARANEEVDRKRDAEERASRHDRQQERLENARLAERSLSWGPKYQRPEPEVAS